MQIWCRYELERANRAGAYFITGPQIQRFGADFLPEAVPTVSGAIGEKSIFDAFPMRCPPPSIVYNYIDPKAPSATSSLAIPVRHHPGTKVVAFRNSMRMTRARDGVVSPDVAELYFGNCSNVQLNSCPRLTVQGPPKSLFHLTPYHKHKVEYRYKNTPKNSEIDVEISLWHDVEWAGMQVPIHKVEWAKELLTQHKEWLERYSGDCELAMDDADTQRCTPLVQGWHTKAAMYKKARQDKPLLPQEHKNYNLSCDEGRLLGHQTDTAYMGLAWEEFETKLKVVSKVRNTIKGDSRTRLERISTNVQ